MVLGLRTVEIFLGPQHPGAPGNVAFKLTLDGERVVDAEVVPGYLHRGFEKLMEYRWWEVNVVMAPRFCVEDPDNFELAYVLAVENLYGIEVPEKAKYVRTIIAEMSRIQSHLFWLLFMGAAVGARYIPSWAMAAREEILKWYDYITGHRIYHHYLVPGGIRWNIPRDFRERTLKVLKFVNKIVDDIKKALYENKIFIARTRGIGILKPQDAIRLSATGPVLRGSGVRYDVRKVDPYEAYDEVEFNIPVGEYGDTYDRCLVRLKEIYESMNIIRQLLDKVEKLIDDKHYRYKIPLVAPPGEGIGRVESARGEYIVHITSTGGQTPYRIRLRTPSMPHLTTVIKHIVKNEEVTIADFPIIVKSLDPCAPDLDR